VPYTVIIYPLFFLILIRLWSVSHRHGFVTPADFVRSPVRLADAGAARRDHRHRRDHAVHRAAAGRHRGGPQDDGRDRGQPARPARPIIVAFAILAAYTYQSGLRAPALIAFVKDTLIYIVIIVAVLYLPYKLGGWGTIFDDANAKFRRRRTRTTASCSTPTTSCSTSPWRSARRSRCSSTRTASPACWPARTATSSSGTCRRCRRTASCSGLIALLGYMAISAGIKPLPGATAGSVDSNTVVPLLFDQQFPAWFAGHRVRGHRIGALVPAAIMSIAAANLFTRNIYKEYISRTHPRQEAQVAKIASLVVKIGAVAFIIFLDPQFSIDLQLIGGVIILQTAPAVALGLYTRWLHRGGLIAGWAAGMAMGLWMLYNIPNAATKRAHFGGSAFPLSKFGFDSPKTIYVGLRGGPGQHSDRGAGHAGPAGDEDAGRLRRHRAGRLLRRRGRPEAGTGPYHPGHPHLLDLTRPPWCRGPGRPIRGRGP
jgi:SSS family solute:Na+ symporter